ncbi:MAG: tetratricopeptide repeat protein [Thermodesulfobacteriota bacterium]
MTKPRGFWVWVFLFCWLASGAGSAAWAKSRGKRAHVAAAGEKAEKKKGKKEAKKKKKGKKTDDDSPAEAAPAPPMPKGIEDPKTLLSLARKQETAGEINDCVQTLAKFVNVYPRHPERAASLLKMAQLSRHGGQEGKAQEIYALTASLYPGTGAGAEARWQGQTLEFYQNLKERDAVAAFKDYLQKLQAMPSKVAPEKIKEPLGRGWGAVGRVLQRSSPCPVRLVEEALALWELHPEGTQPPEAALILGELLQEKGLFSEARSFLQQAREQGTPAVRTRALLGLMEGAWAAKDLPEFVAAATLWRRQHGKITPDLKTRLDKLPLPEELLAAAPKAEEKGDEEEEGIPEEDSLAALADCWSGKSLDAARQGDLLRSLVHFLKRPLPPAMKERLLLQLAQLQWSQGHYPQAAKIYQQLLAAGAQGENSAFYQDRLALSQLKGQQRETALQIYRGLSQGGDNFWELVSRTRLADVELGRLQTEPLP